jgi:GNAT superfamily N-acetyltransferase
MAGHTSKKTKQAPPLSVERLRSGWRGPASVSIRLARPHDTEAAGLLLTAAGDDVQLIPAVRAAIEDDSAASAILAGLGSSKVFQETVFRELASRPMGEAMATISLTLVAVDQHDRTVGALSAVPPVTVIENAMADGFPAPQAILLSLFVAKVHGLAVEEPARGQGIAGVLLKRACQVYQQLGYSLLYGSFEADRDLRAFYSRCGFHRPGARGGLRARPPRPALRDPRREKPVRVPPSGSPPLTATAERHSLR